MKQLLATGIITLLALSTGQPGVAQSTVADWKTLLSGVDRWVYTVSDSAGVVVDTLTIEKVGGSEANDSIYTAIWQLRYGKSGSNPFPIDTDTIFAGCDGRRLVLQGQNQCCPFLELDWPPVIGAGAIPNDTTRIDSVWVAGIKDVEVPAGGFEACAEFVIRERATEGTRTLTLLVSPSAGVTLMSIRKRGYPVPARLMQLIGQSFSSDTGDN